MKRNQRLSYRQPDIVRSLNETARALDKSLSKAGIPSSEKERFLDWTIANLWDAYKTDRMNRRNEIENEVRALGIHLPNGTVNKEYNFCFHLPVEKISCIDLAGAKDLGLDFHTSENGVCTLCGHPNQSGDFTLLLRYNTIEGEGVSELAIPIAFNPDPRSIWKNLPTDRHSIFFKEDTAAEFVKVADGKNREKRKNLIAASQRGRSHAHEGKARDDHFRLHYSPDSEWYVLAVADGAGSAKYSRKGSEIACDSSVEYCISRLLDNPSFEKSVIDFHNDRNDSLKRTELTRQVIDIIYNGALQAYRDIKDLSEHTDNSVIKDFSTTLMFAICKKYDFGWFIASFWVGDGALCLFDKNCKSAKLLGTPDEGEFSGQTRFLTMQEIFRDKDIVAKRMRMAIVPDFTALILMSDGVSDPMFENDRNLNDYTKWDEFWTKLEKGFPDDGIDGVDFSGLDGKVSNQFLNWLGFWSPGNHDDRTIAILH